MSDPRYIRKDPISNGSLGWIGPISNESWRYIPRTLFPKGAWAGLTLFLMRAAAGLPLVRHMYRQAHPRAENNAFIIIIRQVYPRAGNPPRRTFGITFCNSRIRSRHLVRALL